mmetsp:Transcript_130646/g.225961  ORF Transcript_130646/g.225961 Transcript_130646/m.225961 type:complete len:320 (-) Transcript_130646:2338-3297(-)
MVPHSQLGHAGGLGFSGAAHKAGLDSDVRRAEHIELAYAVEGICEAVERRDMDIPKGQNEGKEPVQRLLTAFETIVIRGAPAAVGAHAHTMAAAVTHVGAVELATILAPPPPPANTPVFGAVRHAAALGFAMALCKQWARVARSFQAETRWVLRIRHDNPKLCIDGQGHLICLAVVPGAAGVPEAGGLQCVDPRGSEVVDCVPDGAPARVGHHKELGDSIGRTGAEGEAVGRAHLGEPVQSPVPQQASGEGHLVPDRFNARLQLPQQPRAHTGERVVQDNRIHPVRHGLGPKHQDLILDSCARKHVHIHTQVRALVRRL